ncbi:MAG: GNAT family N-acetyltransferase [Chloroflexota bacterium]
MSLTIQRATIEDAAAILQLQKRAYQSEAALYPDDVIPPLLQTLEALQADFAAQIFLKASFDSILVGSVRARLQLPTCFVGRLIVDPDFQKRGIGTALMLEIEQSCSAAQRFELFTGHKSDQNLRLYQKLGYREFKRESISQSLTLVYMEKSRKANL